MSAHESEVRSGSRFEFGANWSRFLQVLDDARIEEAKDSLKAFLEMNSLADRSFLDVGSGSGLFSLAARMLGARVHSFDYDPKSVACTTELHRRYFLGDDNWTVEEGSVLNTGYANRLKVFDVVYSWGVLHHTGEMWVALDNVSKLVAPAGRIFISIYNDQGRPSLRWRRLKQLYNQFPFLRYPLILFTLVRSWLPTILRDASKGSPLASWRNYKSSRGMSAWHDVIDWIGGYPFEVATPEQIFNFFRDRGFSLHRLKTCAGGIGCNEFLFVKTSQCPP